MLSHLLTLSLLLASVSGQNLRHIIFKTLDGSKVYEIAEGRGTIVGISLTLAGGRRCSVSNLDEYANTFTVNQFRGNQGSMDVFQARDIGNCAGVTFGTTRLPTAISVRHIGPDSYGLDFIDFMLDDNTYTRCTVGQVLRGNTVVVNPSRCTAA